tara:strand:+ start:31 stop:405 length:375 start_codon:yes stop_codon:yes gene_type:complete
MNPFEKIPEQEINHFKEKVQLWVNVDVQIEKLEKQLKDLKKVRDKELEPEITKFMVKYQVKDLNTDSGKLRCQERKTKKGINKNNIKENLSKYLTETDKLNDAINDIWLNREEIISYKIKKCKN